MVAKYFLLASYRKPKVANSGLITENLGHQNIKILVKLRSAKSTKDLFGMNAIEWWKLGTQLFSFLFFKEKLQHVLCVFLLCFVLFCFQSLKLSLLLSYCWYFFSANVFFKTKLLKLRP